jgi:hypothetical protein
MNISTTIGRQFWFLGPPGGMSYSDCLSLKTAKRHKRGLGS